MGPRRSTYYQNEAARIRADRIRKAKTKIKRERYLAYITSSPKSNVVARPGHMINLLDVTMKLHNQHLKSIVHEGEREHADEQDTKRGR